MTFISYYVYFRIYIKDKVHFYFFILLHNNTYIIYDNFLFFCKFIYEKNYAFRLILFQNNICIISIHKFNSVTRLFHILNKFSTLIFN